MDAIQQDTRTLDGPTLAAAAATLLFAVATGALLGYLPDTGSFTGAVDALKNLIYVLTVPLFDIIRRLFARRASRAAHAVPGEGPNLLTVAFVSALVLFVIIEAISWLTGFGMGGVCALLAQSDTSLNLGNCIALGINVMGTVVVGPIMIALGCACGWIWQRLLHGGFLIALVFFAVAIVILFGLDYFILLQNVPEPAKVFQEQMSQVGPVRQIGLQVVLLTVSTVLGYGARRLWTYFAGALA